MFRSLTENLNNFIDYAFVPRNILFFEYQEEVHENATTHSYHTSRLIKETFAFDSVTLVEYLAKI